mmetsp:Transcript_33915/g.87993  ORF Transcript_33915/g.87993 Transcript_33915/m.87993 type:complete len:406 (+) Transcript_33915:236-1453(+)|eukprot:jgi/Tetstr1/424149/TSEL_014755.t1
MAFATSSCRSIMQHDSVASRTLPRAQNVLRSTATRFVTRRPSQRAARGSSSPPDRHGEHSSQRRSSGRGKAVVDAVSAAVETPAAPRDSFDSQAVVAGRYRLDAELGSGSFGVVFRAEDLLTGETVAVKRIKRMTTPRQPAEEQVFKVMEEARMFSLVQDCAYVCHFHGLETDDEYLNLVMEYLEGPSLEDVLRTRGRLSEPEVAALLHDILQVVSICHGEGVCHSDIKPANFLFKPLGNGQRVLKAIDFGCGQQVSPMCPRLTVAKGTPLYSAPEVYDKCYSTEADLWSCGIILFQALTGHLPFWESSEALTKKMMLDGVMQAPLPHFDDSIWGDASPEAKELCARLLVRNRFKRISANEAINHPWVQQHAQDHPHLGFESRTRTHWADKVADEDDFEMDLIFG